MNDSSARTFSADFKRFFLRGLVILLPTVLTLWIMVKAYQFVDNSIAEPLNRGLRLTISKTVPFWKPLQVWFDPSPETVWAEFPELDPQGEKPDDFDTVKARLRTENIKLWWDEHWYMDLIGIVVAIIGVYIAGRLLGGFFGRQIYRKIESVITTLPVFKQVYPYVKQVVDFLFSDDHRQDFNRVVVVEYPRKGIWSVGFQTGPSMKSVAEDSGDSVTIFIPSSPTPFTGYTITVPRSEVRELPITVEEAIRFAVSGGVLVPDHQLIDMNTSATQDQPALASETRNGNNGDQSKKDGTEDPQGEDQRRTTG